MNCKIIGFENGPLEVDCTQAAWEKEGNCLNVENPSYLCRCGRSTHKPFCDGSHVTSGFSSKSDISKEILQTYKGKEITVNFNRSICAGASECVKGLNSVFRSGDGSNWIFPDEESPEKIIKTISLCPSGALSYTINGNTQIDSRLKPKISIVKNGPYKVEGIALSGMNIPTNFSTTKYTLCRCGFSQNKPYCDYSHAQNKWKDDV
jgi:CDGSH-type Zn-finger protein